MLSLLSLSLGKVEDTKTVGGSLQEDAATSAQDFSHTVSDGNNPVSDPSMNPESDVRSAGGDESVAMVTSPSGEDSGRGEITNDALSDDYKNAEKGEMVSLQYTTGGANKRKLEHDVS